MPWTIPPDSLLKTDRTTRVAPRRTPESRCQRSPELELVAATRAYLHCRSQGGQPEPRWASAWDEFYRTYAPLVIRLANSQFGTIGDPEDGVQDVWQAILAKLDDYRPDPERGPFRAWLLVVARRRLADRRRSENRRFPSRTGDESLPDIAGREPDPATVCERHEDYAQAKQLLKLLENQVSPLSYQILALRAIEERPVPEVARIVDLTADQVRARHHRMVAQLRQLAGAAPEHDSAPPKQNS